jgi:DNA-binding transcriptional MerR regulator
MLYLRTKEVADTLGISKRTLQKWVSLNKIPVPQKALNGYYLWSITDFKAALDYKSKLQLETNYRFGEHSKAYEKDSNPELQGRRR